MVRLKLMLKPLSVNNYTINDIFGFVDDLQNETSMLMFTASLSHTMSLRFLLNAPIDETIAILA